MSVQRWWWHTQESRREKSHVWQCFLIWSPVRWSTSYNKANHTCTMFYCLPGTLIHHVAFYRRRNLGFTQSHVHGGAGLDSRPRDSKTESNAFPPSGSWNGELHFFFFKWTLCVQFQIFRRVFNTDAETFVYCGDCPHLFWLLLGGVASSLINVLFSNYACEKLFKMVKAWI